MTISQGRIVLVEYPGIFFGARPGIVTKVHAHNSVDVTVFGASDQRGQGTREYRDVEFCESREIAAEGDMGRVTPVTYYPPRVESTPNVLVDPDKPIAVSGDVVARILDIAAENRGE